MKAPLLRVLRTAWVRAVLGTLLAPIVCLAVAALLEPVPAALVAGLSLIHISEPTRPY